MLLYQYISDFNIRLNPFDIVELLLWIIGCIVLGIVGFLFYLDSKRIHKIFIYASLFFFLYIGARIMRILAKFWVGQEYGTYQFEGIQVLLSILFQLFSYTGLFFYYYFLEKKVLKKTHYVFSIIVVILIVLSIVLYFFPEIMIIIIPVYLFTVLGFPGIYLYLAFKTTGEARRNALIVLVGLMMFIFGTALDAPAITSVWVKIPYMPEFAQFAAPILQIIGCLLIRKGIPKEA